MPIAQRQLLGEVPKVKLFSLNEVNPNVTSPVLRR